MHLFLTSVLPFLAHDHASAAAFLTCRHHNFHSSIIPEFLSDEERVKSFCKAREQNQLHVDEGKQYKNLYNLFVQTPLMQFSPSLVIGRQDCFDSILKPLLSTKYFSRTLQRCYVDTLLITHLFRGLSQVQSATDLPPLTRDLLHALSKAQSLTKLDLGESEVEKEELEIIINSLHSLETLIIQNAGLIKIVDPNTAIHISSPPPPPVTKTLRSLTLHGVDPLFVTQFVPHFSNLRKLELIPQNSAQELDLRPLSCSLPLLTDLSLTRLSLKNPDSLRNLAHLSSLHFCWCNRLELSFLGQEDIRLPELSTLRIDSCRGLDDKHSFASLENAPNLSVLQLPNHDNFNNNCLQYLENMVHLRKLDLYRCKIVGGSRVLKTLMRNLFQLEELSLRECRIGNRGAIAGALYSTRSRLRILNLTSCNLVDDDLNGIGALKNTLQELYVGGNCKLTNEVLVHCKDLVKLKILNLQYCEKINDLSPLKDCLNLEEWNVSHCRELTDDSFKIFSEEPNSFPNLQILDMSLCDKLRDKVFEHLSKNNHLVYQLKDMGVMHNSSCLSSPTARNHIFRLQGLQVLSLSLHWVYTVQRGYVHTIEGEFLRNLKNLEKIK